MKLYLSATSPYARLALLAAISGGHTDLELEFVQPWDNPESLLLANPYSQVPALRTGNGAVLTETLLIMHHLDPNFPTGGYGSILAGFAFSTIAQTVRYFSLKTFGSEGSHLMHRSADALKRALPQAPLLDGSNSGWGHRCLGTAFAYLRMRAPEISESSLSEANRAALAQFAQQDVIRKTDPAALEKKPACIGGL